MGNIQDIICQENSCFDNNYEFDWISDKSWFIDYYIYNLRIKNPYIIEKGIFKITNQYSCQYYLNKPLQNNYKMDNLSMKIKFMYNLKQSNVNFILFLSNEKIEKIFQEVNKDICKVNTITKYPFMISKINFNNNKVTLRDKEMSSQTFDYNIVFNFEYLDHIIVHEQFLDHQKKHIFDISKDNLHLNIFIESDIKDNNSFFNFKI